MMLKATPEEKRNYKNNSQPDWQGMYEDIPSFLQSVGSNSGTPPEAYSWLMEPLDRNGKVASRFVWFLKSTEEHAAADGAVNCAGQPFHMMDRDATWVVARPATDEDEDGEVSDEYLRDGNSLTGLTGCDGKESTMYCWALMKFVYELNKRFLMRGTKETNAMLKAVPQTEQQDGVTFVRSCEKRFILLSSTKDTVTGDMRRRAIEECVSLFRIKLFKDRDKIKDEVEEWSLSIVQDRLRRQSCPYSVYELKQFGIDLSAVVTSIKAAEAKKIAAKKKPSKAKQQGSPEGGRTGESSQKQAKYQKRVAAQAEAKGVAGTEDYAATRINSPRPEVRQNAQMRNYHVKHRFPRNLFGITTKEWSTMTDEQKGLVSANVADQQPDMNKQFAALAKEIKDKIAQDMDAIKSRVSSSSASARGLSDDEEEVGSRAAIRAEFEGGEEPLSAAQGHVATAPQSLSARPANHLEKQMSLLSALLTSSFRALTQIAAVMHQQGMLNSKKISKVLAAIDEIDTTASLALDVGGAQEDCLDEGDDLPDLTDGDDSDSEDGFLDQEDHEIAEHHLRKLGESKPEAEAAFSKEKAETVS
ncbi:hypothetical protein CYMTET_14409 [Cymbomonas tetramitiformis]|uniref:Uncharacterized protein n=1 Tax=Cymbomonas tetramitiformis TaxID=36881 RepID=A0AAE0LAE9_9CHLO|nr:hypothetical protein CYMTET_14409 [Cymbomonas tetramitiformis]